MAKGKGKGSKFERDVCRQLSNWWSKGERDDIYWRTSGSGARATQRSKAKKQTYGQYGDIQASDPIGYPLMRLCCFELKRGYPNVSICDLLELNKGGTFAKWLKQAWKSTRLGGSFYPTLIIKKNNRDALICFPDEFNNYILQYGKPEILHNETIRIRYDIGPFSDFVLMRFADFITLLDSSNVSKILYRLVKINSIRCNGGNYEYPDTN